MSRAVWQISGGPASRAYAEVFLWHGVALVDPGNAGPWNPERDDELIAHFVVPFLRALGWPPERIAVQWHRHDRRSGPDRGLPGGPVCSPGRVVLH